MAATLFLDNNKYSPDYLLVGFHKIC